jgi:hypothetical protein
MKAAWYEKQGAARDVLVVGNMDDPQPSAGEVRIRIAFSGVNPGDVKKREDAFGVGMPYPRVIPHSDGSGTVGATFWWLVAGVMLGSVIPFTLLVILPTNKLLLSPTLDKRSVDAERLLARWGSLHAVRSVLSGLALLLFLYLAIFKNPL